MTITVCGVDLELDIYDVDVYEKFEDAVREVNHKVNEVPPKRGETAAQSLRRQCNAVKEFFDTTFGKGTSDKLFHGKNNIRDCTVAYQIVIDAAGAAMVDYNQEVTKRFDEIRKKYTPEADPIVYHTSPRNIGPIVPSPGNIAPSGPNRAQRRNAKKKRR